VSVHNFGKKHTEIKYGSPASTATNAAIAALVRNTMRKRWHYMYLTDKIRSDLHTVACRAASYFLHELKV
jgi:hypothetical protein